jgi:methyltransferase (TIGR00027 family)
MDVAAFFVFVIVQIAFIPCAIIALILLTITQLFVSKKIGVSATAIDPIAARWIMDVFGMRKDPASVKLYRVLPNGSVPGLWLLLFPSYVRYKISGKNKGYASIKEQGKEGIANVAIARTIYFDRFIHKSKDKAGQFVVMGAGYDTRCYGDLKNGKLTFFELDQPNTQKLKIEYLKKAGIYTSHVHFVEVDFFHEIWYEKLEKAGYDPAKKTIFLWEGVTLYLSENDVRKTLKEHAASGSVLIVDFYDKRLIALKGVKATNEGFTFGLDFSTHHENILQAFIESENVKLGDFYFMGHKTKKGVLGVVAEIIV